MRSSEGNAAAQSTLMSENVIQNHSLLRQNGENNLKVQQKNHKLQNNFKNDRSSQNFTKLYGKNTNISIIQNKNGALR